MDSDHHNNLKENNELDKVFRKKYFINLFYFTLCISSLFKHDTDNI